MAIQSSQVWDLDTLFEGGSKSQAFSAFVKALEAKVSELGVRLSHLSQKPVDVLVLLDSIQVISAELREAGSFVSCLTAQNVNDTEAQVLSSKINQLGASFGAALTLFDEWLVNRDEASWQGLVSMEETQPLVFVLEERRRRARNKLDAPRERLAAALSVDGYSAWGQMYETIVGKMKLQFEENGRVSELSMGQAANKLVSPNRAVREQMAVDWERTWAGEAELFGSVLNHLAGYRLALYKERNWQSVLQEPLEINRMTEQTLTSMWDVVERNKQPFVEFLNRKALLLGQKQLSWNDVAAPMKSASRVYSYDEARELIVAQFSKFSPRMGEFADWCFEKRWIEAEDRPGKSPGGFCTSFPVKDETRIFLTFSGAADNVATLAHELGHAYHQHVMKGLPPLLKRYAMNVAETASTFAERIVTDALLAEAKDEEEQLAWLEDKVSRSVVMFMNIHARYLFETRFYEARQSGTVTTDALNALMTAAQQDAFHNALATYHPHFWASKLHFYLTSVPFYNFPYTFGYLFSTGIYAHAVKGGAAFADRYVDLLRDTGRMTVEDLAAKHLGVNLAQPEFWQQAMDVTVQDAQEFLRRTRPKSDSSVVTP